MAFTHSITINWTPDIGVVSGYNIYRGTGATGAPGDNSLNNSPIVGSSFTDYSVFPGIVYNYEVTAVLNGIESADSLSVVSSPVPFDPTPVIGGTSSFNLGNAIGFGVLAATTITNVPGTFTKISGDLGLYPGTSITGFEAPAALQGSYHIADLVAGAGQMSANIAFVAGNALPGAVTVPADLGGLELGPGVYNVATSEAITGTLVLNAGGNPNAVWIFQIGSTLTTASSNSNIALFGGAQASNVIWLVGSSATLGTNTNFVGTIISLASISVNTIVNVDGRLWSLTGAITLDTTDETTFQYNPNAPEIYNFYILPPTPPNTPPSAPSAPTGVSIIAEV